MKRGSSKRERKQKVANSCRQKAAKPVQVADGYPNQEKQQRTGDARALLDASIFGDAGDRYPEIPSLCRLHYPPSLLPHPPQPSLPPSSPLTPYSPPPSSLVPSSLLPPPPYSSSALLEFPLAFLLSLQLPLARFPPLLHLLHTFDALACSSNQFLSSTNGFAVWFCSYREDGGGSNAVIMTLDASSALSAKSKQQVSSLGFSTTPGGTRGGEGGVGKWEVVLGNSEKRRDGGMS